MERLSGVYSILYPRRPAGHRESSGLLPGCGWQPLADALRCRCRRPAAAGVRIPLIHSVQVQRRSLAARLRLGTMLQALAWLLAGPLVLLVRLRAPGCPPWLLPACLALHEREDGP